MKKILVIEDDKDLNSTIVKFLKIKAFECDSAYDGEVALTNLCFILVPKSCTYLML
jgi:DNA-binding response OmpR family regulator